MTRVRLLSQDHHEIKSFGRALLALTKFANNDTLHCVQVKLDGTRLRFAAADGTRLAILYLHLGDGQFEALYDMPTEGFLFEAEYLARIATALAYAEEDAVLPLDFGYSVTDDDGVDGDGGNYWAGYLDLEIAFGESFYCEESEFSSSDYPSVTELLSQRADEEITVTLFNPFLMRDAVDLCAAAGRFDMPATATQISTSGRTGPIRLEGRSPLMDVVALVMPVDGSILNVNESDL